MLKFYNLFLLLLPNKYKYKLLKNNNDDNNFIFLLRVDSIDLAKIRISKKTL